MDIVPLDVPGARQTVELENPQGIFYKIRVGGEVIKRTKGGWSVPLRNGSTAKIKSQGFIPGFQALYLEDKKIYDMGAGVQLPERIAIFAPLILLIWVPFGLVLGLILFFMGIPGVKNQQMPRGLRIALPLINTVAAAVILTLITGRIGIWG
ncbi:hypothetical protein [Demequina sp.]|uniref:hypothetical protein n=1 Tax=Demequina sp. TaxID=2050685 RepID=UPI003D1068A4